MKFSRELLFIWLLLTLFCLGAYFPVLVHTYGWTDDFSILYQLKKGELTFGWNIFNASGRPILGLIIYTGYSFADSLGGFALLRLVGVLGVGFTSFIFYLIWRDCGISKIMSFCISLLLVLTPAFSVYAGWTICYPYSFASGIALLAGWVHWRILENSSLRFKVLGTGLTSVLLLLIEMVYQPVVGFYFFPLIIYSLFQRFNRGLLIKWIIQFSSFIGVLVIYFVAYKVSLYLWWGEHFIVGQRTGINFIIFERLKEIFWIFSDPDLFGKPFRLALSSWGAFDYITPVYPYYIFGGMILGLVVFLLKKPQSLILLPLITLAVLFIHVPIIVTAEDYLPFRLFAPLHTLVILGVVCWLVYLAKKFKQGWVACCSPILTIALTLFAFGYTHDNLKQGMAEPYEKEVSKLEESILKIYQEAKPEHMLFILPQWNRRAEFYKKLNHFEYGNSPFIVSWAAESYMNMVLIDNGFGSYDNPPVEFITIYPSEYYGDGDLLKLAYDELFNITTLYPANIIDFDQILIHENLGGAKKLSSEWSFSPVFGYIKTINSNSYYDTHLGKVRWIKAESGGAWLETPRFGSLWVQLDAYPIVYSAKLTTWGKIEFSASRSEFFPLIERRN